jgi:pimeloyl-ACP methyl ester carboxylesterase
MLATALDTLPSGCKLRVARLGSGSPLVLLHGYPDNLQIWCALAPRLADRCTVIAFDWPGMGYSDAWPGGTTPTHQAQRLLRLLDLWGIEQAAVVGLDMGGQPALALAALYPQRVRRLVVMNSLVFGDEPTSWEIRVLRKFGWNRLLLRHFPRLVFWRALATFLPWGTRLPAALKADLWGGFRQWPVRAFISKLCAGYQGTLPSLPQMYDKIACPVLALWAEKDGHFPPRQGERLHQAIAGARLEVVPEAKHWMAWYQADEVARRLRPFLE